MEKGWKYNIVVHKMQGSHSNAVEDPSLLGCYTMSTCNYLADDMI